MDPDEFIEWHRRRHRRRQIGSDAQALLLGLIIGCCLIMLVYAWWGPR